MKHLHMITPLSRGMLWRIIPLMIVLFTGGILGVNTVAMLYNQSLPAQCFQTPAMQHVLVVSTTSIPSYDSKDVQRQKKDALHATFLEYDQVEELYYQQSFSGTVDELQYSVSIRAYSEDYLESLNWPLVDTLSENKINRSAIPVWVDHSLKGKYHTGSIITIRMALYVQDQYIPWNAKVQIVGFLPRDNMYPFQTPFSETMEPTLSNLYTYSSVEQSHSYILIAPFEKLLQFMQADPSLSPLFETDHETSFPEWISPFEDTVKVIAFQLKDTATEEDIQFIKQKMFLNAQGSAYTIQEIIQSDSEQWKVTLKRNTNNLYIFLFIGLLGIGGIEFSLIRRKRKEISTLRLLGVSWRTIRQTWLIILSVICGGTCLAGCLLFEAFSSPTSATNHLQNAPLLRFTPVLLVLVVTIIINFVAFIGWRSMEEQEMRRSE